MANICALLGLLLLVHWGHCVDVSNIFVFYNNTYEYGKQYKIHINSSAEYVFEYAQTEFLDAEFPARITVSSPSVTRSYPVFITARQQKGALSWQLPLVVGLQEHLSISRTLCPNKNFFLQSAQPNVTSHDVVTQNHPIIHITTSSSRNLTLFLKVDLVEDFYLKINTAKNITTSPSEPIVYYYSFEYGALDGVLDLEHIGSRTNVTTTQTKDGNYKLKVPGDSSRYDSSPSLVPPRDDDFTRYLYNPARDAPDSPGSPKDGEEATSNYSSPVWDLARNVLRASIFNGINESLKTVVIRLDSNDDTCMLISIQNASCPVFDTERDIAYEGFYATISRSGGITVSQRRYPLGFYIVLLVRASDAECSGSSDLSNFARFFDWKIEDFAWSKPGTRPRDRAKNVRLRIIPSITYQQYWVAIVVALAAIFSVYLVFLVGLTCFKSKPRTMETLDQAEIESTTRENGTSIISSPTTACSALDIATANYGIRRGSYSSLGEAGESGEVFLSELCTKDNKALSQRSSMFLWTLLTVAVFYGLPVVQLVITYQRVLNQTGNQDQCYYNFLCAHPLGLLSDFNHVYSNLGYVMLGALFLLFVWRKHRLHTDPNFDKFYGIPPHYGIYYAMGVALMMEGVLSGSYHVCPNHTNFQFDTSFMYVMAVLCMVKIYQTRHPDINARAHGTFGVLACAVFIGLIGVLYPNFYFWVIFTFIHIGTCLVLTLQVYYLGRLRFTWGCCSKCVCGGLCRPAYRGRCVLVLLANLCNWALAAWGLYRHSKDFATHLLYIFLMNLALHLFWYLAMKLLHRERIVWPAAALLLIGSVTWGGALYFFFDNSTSWALTPAQSRSFNTGCGLLSFYDNHDVWHFLSAAAMFFSFMLLLVIDDDLAHSPRHKIPVF